MQLSLFKNSVYKDRLILLYGIPLIAILTSIVGTDYSTTYIFGQTTFWWMVCFSYLEVLGIWFFFRLTLIKIDQYVPFTAKNGKQRLLVQLLFTFVGYVLFRLLFIPLSELFFNRPFNWRIHFNSDLPLAIILIALINLLYYHWGWVHLQHQTVDTVLPTPTAAVPSKPSYISTQRSKKFNLVHVKEIAFFYKKDGLTYLKKRTGETLVLDESLKSILDTYDLEQFYRVNRQFLVHYTAIHSYQTLPNRQLQINLDPASSIPCKVNKNNAKAFKEWIKKER